MLCTGHDAIVTVVGPFALADPVPRLTVVSAARAWQFDTTIVVALAAAAAVYVWAVWRVAARHPARPWPLGRTLSWLAGLAVIAVATLSSVGVYDDLLFWVHMVQHLLLIMVAPVLLVLGRPGILALHASRNPVHMLLKRVFRSWPVTVITCPPVAAAAYAATVILTHLTGFMNLVLTDQTVHDGEHLLYLVVGFVYFLPAIGDEPIRWRLSYPARAALVLVSMPVDTLTGVVLTMYPSNPWPAYAAVHQAWMPSLVTDVHWGGAVMWIGGDAIMAVLMVIVAVWWARAAGTSKASLGWLEAARHAALAEHTRAPAGAGPGPEAGAGPSRPRADVDNDEDTRAAYNAWLAGLENGSPARDS